jgi:hypothetical protein
MTILIGLMAVEAVSGQIADLQDGRNFADGVNAFGAGRTTNIDAGDLDNDGDYDLVVANGGDGSAQQNRIYLNSGGVQGGVQGDFTDDTDTRFAGMVVDTSRDVEFADWDGDWDLDLIFANRGSTVNGGEPTRAYLNQGGQQLGSVGFFSEDTNGFWGSLISVPADKQVLGGNAGPFRDYSCDCDFGDLDLDGDVDLFHSSYGPNLNGAIESRIFLNDGTGRFDERWPWADPAADVKLHTWDIDLADLDGDFDLDVFATSRDSQSRVYRNDLDLASGTWPSHSFTDITQAALIDTGAAQLSSDTYEGNIADLDGDGDFDVWATNYDGLRDVMLLNQGDGTFLKSLDLIKGDPNMDEQEADMMDFDGDGDLDVYMANFSGTNRLYQSALADGEPFLTVGLMHRTGFGGSGGLAPWPEMPANGNGGISMDAECVDTDGDGDPDVILANDLNSQNKFYENVLGIPDTHAPTLNLMTVQGDKADGSDTPIRAQLLDNAPYYVVFGYRVDLVWSVDGGLENRVPMTSQWGWSFQASIPGGVDGTVTYRVQGADDAGNAFVSGDVTYEQTSSGDVLLLPVGEGTDGVGGIPTLTLYGTFTGGSDVDLTLCDAAPGALCLLLFSTSSTPLPFKGGLLHTVPVDAEVFLTTDSGGVLWLDATWPGGIPAGAQLWQQLAVADASATGGASLSNAVLLTTP